MVLLEQPWLDNLCNSAGLAPLPDAHKESTMTRLLFYLSVLCLGFAFFQGANAQQESNAGQAQQPGPEYLTSPATTILKRPFSEAVRVGNMLYLSGARSAFATNGPAFGARVEIECLAMMR